MKLTGTFIFLGIKTFVSPKQPDKVFKSGCFLQGTDTLEVFLNEESEKLLIGIQPMDNVQCDLDIRFGQKTFTSIASVKKLQSKVA